MISGRRGRRGTLKGVPLFCGGSSSRSYLSKTQDTVFEFILDCYGVRTLVLCNYRRRQMKMKDIVQQLCALSSPAPHNGGSFNNWLEHEDALQFLKENAKQEELVMYAGLRNVFIHAVAIPSGRVNPPDVADLMSWDFNAHGGVAGVSYCFNPPDVRIERSLSHTSTKTFDGGTKFIFPRSFEGLLGENHYYEILQEFLHFFDLHFMSERKAYCRLDKHGDIEDMIRIINVPRSGDESGGTIILFKREILDEWMALTDSVVVQTFDFTRLRTEEFKGWPNIEPRRVVDGELIYRTIVEKDHASYVRGVQIIRSEVSKEDLISKFSEGFQKQEEDRKYASFIAFDFKNRVVREISTAPEESANYFTKSDLPFEMSPAFFKPDVLLRYKSDKDKYTLGDRSISCRGAWDLQTYDINEAGQVHTYIVYLRRLPYEEQLYWKAHNEAPKGSISKRAFTTDFEGQWHFDYDALPSLKSLCQHWHERQVPWWKLRSESKIGNVHYPVTNSADEWADELMSLDQLVVEGFEEKWLRQRATELGRNPDGKLRSLKLIEECMIGLGYEGDHARQIIAPLHLLHELRSKVKGHASGGKSIELRRKALSSHKTYPKHFESLAGECDDSLRAINEAFSG